jgi:hypothetical protein
MGIMVIGVIIGSLLSVFIGMQLCGRCCMRPRYINLEDYDEIV